MSCCGTAKWNYKQAQWECEICNKVISNDPSYLGNILTGSPQTGIKSWGYSTSTKKCTCGSSSVGSDRHSDYCDLYVK